MTFEVSGPFHYPHDCHPCFRIATSDRIVASVFFVDDEEERGLAEAELIAKALNDAATKTGQLPGYTQYTDFRP